VVTPGVLQPASATGINTPTISAGDLQVYPSPVENMLYLQPAFNKSGVLQYNLFDAAGKLVIGAEARLQAGNEKQTVEVSQISVGQYTLQVNWIQSGVTYTAGYKIQKLN
jgi:hypothetical protein